MNELGLSLEQLEERFLLSGNVYAQGESLFVEGTTNSDLIEVRQIASEIRVLVNGFDHGMFQAPTGVINVNAFAGNDDVRFQAGVNVDARVFGGTGDDVIRTGSGNDEVVGGAGTDIIFGRDGDDQLLGSAGHDVLRGQSGSDSLVGGVGEDYIVGGVGDDSLVGGADNDTLIGQSGCLLYTSPSPRDRG